MMVKYDWYDIAERALWTAAQAFLGALPAGFALTDLNTLRVAAVAGITAGAAFLISVFKNMAKQHLETIALNAD